MIKISPKYLDFENISKKCIRVPWPLKISQNSQEKTCVRVFFNKAAGLRPATLLKKRLWHRCFPVNFVK